ncbi:MAG: hypothetical protein P4L22_07845 [Candidatus Babeliales bacterium]|nr:hypothetical protein [Candidatus Babeliales bacterium]
MKQTIRSLTLIIVLLCNSKTFTSIITTLNKTDPAPIFTCDFPYDYLYVNEKEFKKGRTNYDDPLCFNFVVSPFYQRANNGKDLNGNYAQLGDIGGKLNILAFLPFSDPTHPDLPKGYEFTQEMLDDRDNLLGCIRLAYNYNGTSGVPTFTPPNATEAIPLPIAEQLKTVEGLISLQDTGRTVDQELFGFFSVPIKYRKYGVRFETNAKLFADVGVTAQTGVAKISQVAVFYDQINCPLPQQCIPGTVNTPNCATCIPSGTNLSQPQALVTLDNPFQTQPDSSGVVPDNAWYEILNCLSRDVMNRLQDLAASTNNGLCNFNKTSIEDLHVELFWRRAFEIQTPSINECLTCGLFIPFASFGADIPTAAKSHPDQFLSVPFGNNGHYALRFNAGFTFDFTQTIEFGGHAGLAYFLPRKHEEYRMPNNMFQAAMYPFKTAVEVKPGATWHVGLVMNAYSFMDCLSFWGEYLYISHEHDKIRLLNPDNAFKPGLLECQSPWSAQVINLALNYDVSRNFKVGAVMQLPVQEKHAYKTSTYMISTEFVF